MCDRVPDLQGPDKSLDDAKACKSSPEVAVAPEQSEMYGFVENRAGDLLLN